MPVRVPLQFVKPTMRLARPICDAEGRVVAGSGTLLGERVVRVLRTMAVQTVVVQESDELKAWETVRPLAEELDELEARFRRGPQSGPLAELKAAIARHLRRRDAALGGESA
jgi:hypothetical protein